MEMNVYSEIILQAFQECVISTSRVFGAKKRQFGSVSF